METTILDGKKLSTKIEDDLTKRVKKIIDRTKRQLILATILVGNDPSSKIYVNMKTNACQRVGLGTKKIELPENTTTDQLLEVIDALNKDKDVFGILLQHPVPNQIDERACFNKISVEKDVDGVTAFGFGQMSFGKSVFVSATPGGIIKLLKYYDIPVLGKKATVIGRSAILGKPIAMLLLNEKRDCDDLSFKTENLKSIVQDSNIVVAAIGKPELIDKLISDPKQKGKALW